MQEPIILNLIIQMNTILILDNPLRHWLILLGVIVAVLLVRRFLSRYIASLLYRLVKNITRGVEKRIFVDLVVEPLEFFLVVCVAEAALDKLKFPAAWEFDIYNVSSRQIVASIGISIIIITFIWVLLRLIDFIANVMEMKADLTADQMDNQLIVFFKDFLKVILAIIGILLVIRFGFGKDISELLTGLSIVGAAIALAMRESLENLIASFIIFFDKPFRLGDVVKVQQVTGTVEKIGLRSTRIRTEEKTFVTVPNKQMVDSIVDNFSLRTQRKGDLNLEINPLTKEQIIEIFLKQVNQLLEQHEGINEHSANLTSLGRNGLLVHIEYFTAVITISEFNRLKQEVNLEILKLMEKNEVKMAEGRN